MEAQQIGIVDMGSNSIRFVIYKVDHLASYQEILNLKVTARLSTYITKEGKMTKEGINVIIDTLKKFETVVTDFDLTEIRGVATAAVRNATNQLDIIHAINERTPFTISILSEEEEAYYGYLAITNSTNIHEGVTVDIGGGSTEITYYKNRVLKHSHSFPFGAITLKKRFVENNSPTKEEWQNIRQFLQDQYDKLPWLKGKKVPVIGIGGSARNIALVHQNYISYPLSGLHQYEMSKEDVSSIQEKLSSLPFKKREKVDGLSKDRADIILPAIAAIEELIHYVQSNEFIVSNKGLRDGLFYEILLKPMEVTHFPDVTNESFYQLAINFRLNDDHQRRISVLSSYLAHELLQLNEIELSEMDFKHLKWGANVFYLGHAINPESQSQHSFYLLTNQSIDGLSHIERLTIAFLSSFKSRSQLYQYAVPYRHWISKEELSKFELMGSILKLSYAFDVSKRDVVQRLEVTNQSKLTLTVNVFYRGEFYFESFHANKYKKHLERCLNKSIHLEFIEES
ncbi:exopolyphosphatase [Salipaludibacillus daqingensis]|uniref:exopolyphosphatase n=1 Tax=Salipaludibacillus daqingensis TaxID=3041001 RepID=UPI00247712BA|nr:exopolyphosphatase [Salipaludibacillus daqingensis]